eukprot:928925-Prorocentrum_lima.AAC.1
MTSSLVGSEMCIRDSETPVKAAVVPAAPFTFPVVVGDAGLALEGTLDGLRRTQEIVVSNYFVDCWAAWRSPLSGIGTYPL